MGEHSPACRLKVYGPARLECDGEPLALRRKALALLYFLAFEGPTRRERAAELLWNRPRPLSNLRAELHYLREKAGLELGSGKGLLRLPENVVLDYEPTPGEALEGLEGLTPGFDDWLIQVRFELALGPRKEALTQRARRLSSGLPVPGLWIFDAPVGADTGTLVELLSKELNLTLTRDLEAPDPRSLLYLQPPYPSEARPGRLLRWPGVVAIERPPFGEEPTLILELRSRYPAERARYLRWEPLSFQTARTVYLEGLAFPQAAWLYLMGAGRGALLAEARRAGIPLPLRFRALYRAEARRLPKRTRHALERLAVCRSRVENGLVQALDLAHDVEELERRRWLVYDQGWRFADPVARRSLLYDLPPGLKRVYHLHAAQALEASGRPLPAAWHRREAGEAVDLEALAQRTGGYAAALFAPGKEVPEEALTPMRPGPVLPLLEVHREGPGIELGEDRIWLLRPEYAIAPGWVEWEPFERTALLELTGEVYVFAPLKGALDGVPPIELRIGSARVALAPVAAARRLADGTWLWPANGRFRLAVRVPPYTPIALGSRAPEVAAELQLRAHQAGTGYGAWKALDPFKLADEPARGTPLAS